MDANTTIPSRRVLISAMETNRSLGHENLGFLSDTHGSMPVVPPLRTLNPAYAAWDGMAGRLPVLTQSLTLRKSLNRMPLLRANDPQMLGDAELLRAAALIGAFAHAYHYIGAEPPAAGLPPAILTPWRDIAQRLQRPEPHLSYIDMSTYNWRLRDAASADPLIVENLDLLVPVWGNEAERIFLAATIETQAKSTPILKAIVQAQEAAVRDDAKGLEAALTAMIGCLHHLTRVCLAKISPRHGGGCFVDPVCWAKTVAPLSTPLRQGPAGPAGAATLTFQALDVFLGREDYRGRVGQASVLARRWYPKHWRDFCEAIGAVSVPAYVQRKTSPLLSPLFREVVEAYAGDGGYLGRHRMKTYGYIETAFKSGRAATAAFSGSFADRVWETVDDELQQAQYQRGPEPVPARRAPQIPNGGSGTEPDSHAISEIVMHNTHSLGYWLIIDGWVHDIGAYRDAHPGGFKILRAHAGMDATAAYRRAGHHRHPQAAELLAALRIGAVRRLPALAGSEDLRACYGRWVEFVFKIVEIENALHNDYSVRQEAAVAGETAESVFLCPAKLLMQFNTHKRFAGELLPMLADAAVMLPEPEQAGRQAESAGFLAEHSKGLLTRLETCVNVAGESCAAELKQLQGVCLTLEYVDLALIGRLKLLSALVLQACEDADGPDMEDARTAANVAGLGFQAALGSYCRRLAALEPGRG